MVLRSDVESDAGSSEDFDPGPGWREVEPAHQPAGTFDVLRMWDSKGRNWREWVREAPVPPLPTEPGYYQAEAPQYGGTVIVELLNSPSGQWVDSGDREYLTTEDVRALGPLVRLEPRAVTAKAVLDRVRATVLYELLMVANPDNGADLDEIAREFGVES